MSSNIKISRICDFCGNAFLARTTVTRFCSKTCNSRFYKKEIRDKKLLKSLEETHEKLKTPKTNDLGSNRPVLNVVETCQLLGISRSTLWRLIKQGRIKTIMIGRRVIIARADIYEFIKL
ncbi:helix-turn-helix domain-containing protein [Sphingobacterium sp. SGL-16]|uniref:helix-turn-helix domain-containing protein n=1 Tax=Sphingobacterium sp. SGL-16 TaxID=2710883 RepID=UPI0013EC4506|nr:helix-turn-helix domain-containing protein [Sphingobacterium sp. SGL-16]NGM72854.1 helix-turn-helix domain-containing protein [Sphingobacterium sp. SGL-16]